MFISTPLSGYHPSGGYPTLFDFVFQPGMRHKRPRPIFATPNLAAPLTDSIGWHLDSALDHKASVRPEAHLEALFGTLSVETPWPAFPTLVSRRARPAFGAALSTCSDQIPHS